MLKFNNPAINVILALVIAHCLNDLLSTPVIGSIPITPVQVTIFISIIYLIFLGRKLQSRIIKRLFVPLYIYFIVIIISTILTFIEFRQFELYVLTLGFNLLLLRSLAPYLEMGFISSDLKKLVLILIYLIVILVVVPGLYEAITRSHLLQTQKGISANIFYVRALFTDKIEFGSMLGLLVFMLILLLEIIKTTFARIIIIFLIMVSLLLTFFSFSSTAIIGIISGSIVLYLYNIKAIFVKSFLAVLVLFVAYSFISDTPLFEEQVRSYNLKYSLNIERYDERNFRYLSFVKGFESFVKNPFFGSGVSQSQVIIQKLLGTKKQINPHNIISTELIDYGLLGTFFLCLFLFKLYRLMTVNRLVYLGPPHLYFLQRLVLAVGILVLFRLVLYYHRFDQTIYFLWVALLIATYGTYSRILFELKKKSSEVIISNEIVA